MYTRETAFRRVLATAVMLGSLALGSFVDAARPERGTPPDRGTEAKQRLCERLEQANARLPIPLPLPPFCTPPPPPPTDLCPLVTGVQTTTPCLSDLCVPPATWDSVAQACIAPPPPPPVDVCPLVTGIQEAPPCASDLCVWPATWDAAAQACVTPPPPPPVDVCPLVTGVQESGPCASDICVLPATWDVTAQLCVAPPPVDVCPLVTGVQETGPCASDACVLPATWSVDTQACVTPPPPGLDHIVMSEIYYDVDAAHGTEPAHEWVELHNPTASAVDVSGWSIIDTSGAADTIPSGTTIPSGGYVVLAASDTLSTWWSIPSAAVVVNLASSLGNGLSNTGDGLTLRNAALTPVDALSWGTDTAVFAIPAPDVAEGHSLARSPVGADTNLAADWVDREAPTPGQ